MSIWFISLNIFFFIICNSKLWILFNSLSASINKTLLFVFNPSSNIINLSSNNVKISKIQPHTKMINEEGLYLLLNKSTKSFAKNIIEKFYTET